MPELNMVESVRLALEECLRDDPAVMLLGEDIGVYGGAFKVTEGLYERFGPERVIDTPLSESGIVGSAPNRQLVVSWEKMEPAVPSA